jgi:hypothetical protein
MHGGLRGTDAKKDVHVGGKPQTIVGYNPKYDVYKRVLDELIDEINKQDQETEIWVIAFNDKVCQTWNTIATPEGKANLIANLQTYCNMAQTNTSIYNAMDYALKNILTNDGKENIVKILTDGEESKDTRAQFEDLIKNWCQIVEQRNIIGSYYFLLSDVIIQKQPDLVELLENNCFKVSEDFDKPKYSITGTPIFTLEEKNLAFSVNFEKNSTKSLESDTKIRIWSEDNDYIVVDQEYYVNSATNTLQITPQWKDSQSKLERLLPSGNKKDIKLNVDVIGGKEELEVNTNGEKFSITVKNGRIKTMKIAFK